MKRFFSLMLTIIFILSITCVSYAESSFNIDSNQMANDVELTVLTDQEVIQHLSTVNNISLEEATKMFQQSIPSDRNIAERTVNTQVKYTYKASNNYSIVVGAVVRMYNSAGYTGYESVVSGSEYALASGIGQYTYRAGNVGAFVITDKKLQLTTAGVFEVKKDGSITAAIQNDLQSFGFTLGSSSYFRKDVVVDHIVTLK